MRKLLFVTAAATLCVSHAAAQTTTNKPRPPQEPVLKVGEHISFGPTISCNNLDDARELNRIQVPLRELYGSAVNELREPKRRCFTLNYKDLWVIVDYYRTEYDGHYFCLSPKGYPDAANCGWILLNRRLQELNRALNNQ